MTARTDKEHVAALFDEYYESLSKIAFCYLKSVCDAQDVAEVVSRWTGIPVTRMLASERAKPEFESREHEKAWLIRVTVNKCKNRIKHSKYVAAGEPVYAVAPSPESGEILEAVMSLPEKYRAVIHMFYYMDMTAAEIARALKISETAVTTRLSRARKLLEPHMKGE